MKKYLGLLVVLGLLFASSLSVSAAPGKCWRVHWTINGNSGQGAGLLSEEDAQSAVDNGNATYGAGTHTMEDECDPV